MIIREDAIYGRQSVDRKDSISIESQIEFCKYELRGGNFRKYTDKGYSGKNTDRPKFQEMMADIRRGLIKRVVVYTTLQPQSERSKRRRRWVGLHENRAGVKLPWSCASSRPFCHFPL